MPEQKEGSAEQGVYRGLLGDTRLASVVLASVIATLGTNVASPALPAISSALAVSDSRIGLVISVYSFMAMLSVPFTGVIADIYGRRTVLLPSVLFYGLAGSAISLVTTFEGILVLRALQGLSYGAIMPLSVTLIGDLYTGDRAAAAHGIRVGANGLSAVATPAIAGILAGIAWNYPFLMYLLFVPVLVLTFRALPETVESTEPDVNIRRTLYEYGRAIRSEVTDLNLGVLLFGEFVRDVVRYSLYAFVPLFAVRSLGASIAVAGSVLSVRGLVYIVMGPSSGSVVKRFSRKQALIGSLLLSAASVALIPRATSIVWLAVLLGIYTIGDALVSPVIKDTVTALASDQRRGGIVSSMNMLKYAGQTASPAILGIVLAVAGFTTVFISAAAVAVGYTLILSVFISTDI